MIYIAQCLCPSRHCIIAVAFDEKDGVNTTLEQFEVLVKNYISEGKINPWCGICGSEQWSYEAGRTRFETMEEALPQLERLERQQSLTRAILSKNRTRDRN